MGRGSRVAATLLAFALMWAAAACGSTYIGNTKIPDTDDNREVYERVMEYREAIESRNSEAILGMVSRRYFENSSTTDRSTDDYGYDRVKDALASELVDNVVDVQLRILMRRISVDGDRAFADYEYFYTFKFIEGGATGWQPKNDFNRLEFIREDGVWKITGGL